MRVGAGLSGGSFCTSRHQASAASPVSRAETKKASRHPSQPANQASGAPASKIPICERAKTRDSARVISPPPYQRAQSTTADMKEAAQPMPISARATSSVVPSVARPCSTRPSTAMALSAATTSRGPNRSSAMPTGSCMIKSAPKNMPLAAPNMAGESARSALNSGAITPRALR